MPRINPTNSFIIFHLQIRFHHETHYDKIRAQTGADVTVMKNGEHWFHTEEQMRFLDEWIMKKRL